ncbi:SHOCT domain-containing protein [Colwellia sp. D2M02]|uniref:SHOCT domain-containing protein n=1 Tax=Colwellia sp. D2M02 TaxID=2841562 RepID=UPI001C0A3FF1|nr:SHOCT domain-containing protein [Colwellia sp. D2M02]MBU2894598.1 SHOCT domain-containing protein [Colwellia sp. D2M02]
MSSIPKIFNTEQLRYFFLLLFVIFLLSIVLFTPYSRAFDTSNNNSAITRYISNHTLQLSKANEIGVQSWEHLIAHPGKSSQYFAGHLSGKIYLVEQSNEQNAKLLLDLAKIHKNTVSLNAVTLHPNFLLKDEPGYKTFYTAHTESTDKTVNTLRIEDNQAAPTSSADAVIIEWQLSSMTSAKVDTTTKREVVRIALANVSDTVTQLSFHPDRKPWDEDFGLLYIALNGTESLTSHPLYSGTILRIIPNQFGLRSYSVPTNNPYLNNSKIHNSIFLVGAQKVQQFVWPKKHNDQLVISHHYHNQKIAKGEKQQLLSLSLGGEDWRFSPPTHIIYQDNSLLTKNSIISYKGRSAKNLRNKILMLHSQPQWHLRSVQLSTQDSYDDDESLSSTLEWQLPNDISPKNTVMLFETAESELLLLNTKSGAAHQLLQSASTATTKLAESSSTGIFTYLLFALIACSLVVLMFYRIQIKKLSAKTLVRKQYARMVLSTDLATLSLYKRHHRESSRSIKLCNISACQILLGDDVINTIDNESSEHGFSDQHEQALRDIFQREQTDKMVDGKVRKISLSISEPQKINATVCLYLRKGSDRITKKGYFVVIDELIDWCWLIANTINASNTGTRAPLPNKNTIPAQPTMITDTAPLHQQADTLRPTVHVEEANLSNQESLAPTNNAFSADDLNTDSINKNDRSTITKASEPGVIDTELVNALEKLVQLNKQGFLSADEFAQAKAKLLSSLIDTN